MIDVDVADTGIGMAPEKLVILFDIAQKTTTSGTDGEPGTGLGMPLCKELAEKQGERVHVASIPGEGSVFKLSLPEYRPGESA